MTANMSITINVPQWLQQYVVIICATFIPICFMVGRALAVWSCPGQALEGLGPVYPGTSNARSGPLGLRAPAQLSPL